MSVNNNQVLLQSMKKKSVVEFTVQFVLQFTTTRGITRQQMTRAVTSSAHTCASSCRAATAAAVPTTPHRNSAARLTATQVTVLCHQYTIEYNVTYSNNPMQHWVLHDLHSVEVLSFVKPSANKALSAQCVIPKILLYSDWYSLWFQYSF